MKKINRIAVFHCTARVGSAWACAEGICLTLERMGYEVLDCGRPEQMRVSVEQLSGVDLIILSAPEWYTAELKTIYGNAWNKLSAIKVAWFAESAHRDDRDFSFADVRDLVNYCYYPAIQDAHEFGGIWLPFGVDTNIFYPKPVTRNIDVGFLGAMYPKRTEYVKRINYPITYINSVSDPNYLRSFELLADAYSSVQIFVNLPALSRLLVTKVTEIMACGTMLITPKPDHDSALRNLDQFEDGKHLIYYDPNKPEEIARILTELKKKPLEVSRIANNGLEKVIWADSLDKRLQRIIQDVEFGFKYIPLIESNKPSIELPFPLISTTQGKYFICNENEFVQNALTKDGNFEPLASGIAIAIAKLIRGTVVDIGANIGAFSIPVARALPNNRIVSYEPQRMVFMHFCSNLLVNKLINVFPRNIAIGFQVDGKSSISVPDFNVFTDEHTGSVSLNADVQRMRGMIDGVPEPSKWASKYELVPILDLDSALHNENVAFIKIDVEGMELQVLRSGEATLTSQKPCLFFEAWLLPQFSTMRSELLTFIMGLGYVIFQLGDDCFAFHPEKVSALEIKIALATLGLNVAL